MLTGILIIFLTCGTSIHAEEYCNGETFKPTCGLGEVVVIDNAIYGRMHMGRCVTIDLGNVCQTVTFLTIMPTKLYILSLILKII